MIDSCGSKALIEVDGGVNLETGALLAKCGVDALVAGNAVFNAPNPAEMITNLKNL
jgi:ribulose-phosphate 3-epimerase